MEESWAWNIGVLVLADGPVAEGKVVELYTVCLALTCQALKVKGLLEVEIRPRAAFTESRSWQRSLWPHPFGHC